MTHYTICAALTLYNVLTWIVGRLDRSVCEFLVFSRHLFTSQHVINCFLFILFNHQLTLMK